MTAGILMRRLVAPVLALGTLLAACGGGAPSAASTSASAAPPAGTTSASQDLIARARASDHVVRVGMEGEEPAIIKAREEAFEKRFGFPVRLENEPGHIQRDLPVKVSKAAEAGRGAVDIVL